MFDFKDGLVPNEVAKELAKKEEPRFLSILLKHKERLLDAVGTIKPSYFWCRDNGFLFKIVLENYKTNTSLLTRSAMESILERQDQYSDVHRSKCMMHWDAIYNNPEEDVEDYNLLKESVRSRHVQQQVYIKTQNALDMIKQTKDQIDLAKNIQVDFNEIDGLHENIGGRSIDFTDALDEAWDHVIQRRDHPELERGYMVGIRAIDDRIMGFQGGDYIVFTGHTGGGKTTMMVNVGLNMAKANYNGIYISLEKEHCPLAERLLCLHALVDVNRIKRGGTSELGLTPFWIQKMKAAKEELQNDIKPKLHIISRPIGTPWSVLLGEVEKKRRVWASEGKKLDFIVLDYLEAVGFETSHPGRPDLDLANIHTKFLAYIRQHKALGITALQLKTDSAKSLRGKSKSAAMNEEDAANLEINAEDIGGSKKVLADANYMIGVLLNHDFPPTKMFLHFGKTRDSERQKTATLDFDGRTGLISDPEFAKGEIKNDADIESLIYGDGITEADLQTDTDLFDKITQQMEKVSENEASATVDVSDENKVSATVDQTEENHTSSSGTEEKSDDYDYDDFLKDVPLSSSSEDQPFTEQLELNDDDWGDVLKFE